MGLLGKWFGPGAMAQRCWRDFPVPVVACPASSATRCRESGREPRPDSFACRGPHCILPPLPQDTDRTHVDAMMEFPSAASMEAFLSVPTSHVFRLLCSSAALAPCSGAAQCLHHSVLIYDVSLHFLAAIPVSLLEEVRNRLPPSRPPPTGHSRAPKLLSGRVPPTSGMGPFPLVGCANTSSGLSTFHCSVSGSHTGEQRPWPLAWCIQGDTRGCREVRMGQMGRVRPLEANGHRRLRRRGFKERARVSGERPIGAACFRQQYNQASCLSPHLPPQSSLL